MTVKQLYRVQIRHLHDSLLGLVQPGMKVLDVGCGLAKYHGALIEKLGAESLLTAVDAFEPYLDNRRAQWPNVSYRLGRAEQVLPEITERFDLAIAIDVLEHFERPLAEHIFSHMRRCANAVAVFVPRGNHPQDHDHLEQGADELQTHRSTWQPDDLANLGCQSVEIWHGFHSWAFERYADVPDFSPDALWGVWRRP